MSRKSVTKHNELIQAGYRLTLNEARIVLYGISLINPLSDNFPIEYQINIKKFSEMFGLENDKNTYGLIKEAVMGKFWERELTINLNQTEKKRLRWLTSVTYGDKKGYLKVFFNPELKPLLHQLKGSFTSYHLDHIALFKSIYSVRLYEIALMHLNKSKKSKLSFKMTISDVREQLELGEKYKKFANLRIRVIESAIKEMNKPSDIHLSFKLIRENRHPSEIEFTVKKKTPLQDSKLLNNNSLSPPIIEKATWMIDGAQTGWGIEDLQRQFWEYTEKKGEKVRDIENAFIGFVKNKILKPV